MVDDIQGEQECFAELGSKTIVRRTVEDEEVYFSLRLTADDATIGSDREDEKRGGCRHSGSSGNLESLRCTRAAIFSSQSRARGNSVKTVSSSLDLAFKGSLCSIKIVRSYR